MTFDEVKAILGTPLTATPASLLGSNHYGWHSPDGPPNGQLFVSIDRGKKVITTSVRLDSRYATAEGIRVGFRQEQVVSRFVGRGEITYYPGFNAMVYQDKGIMFFIDNPTQVDQVVEITVCIPKKC